MHHKFTTLHNLNIFLKCIEDSEIKEIHFLRSKYLKDGTCFDEVISFLLNLGVVSMIEEKILCSDSLIEVLSSSQKEIGFKNLIINNLLLNNNVYHPTLYDFFSNFVLNNNRFQFLPDNLQIIKHASLRDLLKDLEVINVNEETPNYTICPANIRFLSKFITSNICSVEDFNGIQKIRLELGICAEKIIIKYEEDLLSSLFLDFPEILHLGQTNINIGYDILSYEPFLDKSGHFVPKYIEVKAVSEKDYKFYWTRNEMRVAKEYSSRYYLYLLPFISLTEYNLDKLEKIPDPYYNIYQCQDKWDSNVELTSFSLK